MNIGRGIFVERQVRDLLGHRSGDFCICFLGRNANQSVAQVPLPIVPQHLKKRQ